MAQKSTAPGGGGRFQKLTQDLTAKGMSQQEAGAIAANAGRKKFGKAKMQKWASAGRKRSKK